MEIKLINVETDFLSVFRICYLKYKKLDIILVFLKSSGEFFEAYCLNVPETDGINVSRYHFYTIEYCYPSVRTICLLPHPDLLNYGMVTEESKILERIDLWYQNNVEIIKYGIDFKGQPHGKNINEFYRLISEEGLTPDEASKKISSYEPSLETLESFNQRTEIINVSILKNKSIANIINSSQKYQFVKELFEEN